MWRDSSCLLHLCVKYIDSKNYFSSPLFSILYLASIFTFHTFLHSFWPLLLVWSLKPLNVFPQRLVCSPLVTFSWVISWPPFVWTTMSVAHFQESTFSSDLQDHYVFLRAEKVVQLTGISSPACPQLPSFSLEMLLPCFPTQVNGTTVLILELLWILLSSSFLTACPQSSSIGSPLKCFWNFSLTLIQIQFLLTYNSFLLVCLFSGLILYTSFKAIKTSACILILKRAQWTSVIYVRT